MGDIERVEILANEKLNFGKYQGKLLYVAKGERKVVPLTPTVDHYAKVGLLKIIGEIEDEAEATLPENYAMIDNELPSKKEAKKVKKEVK